ncbi:hypothetical protein ABVT39_020167 [Epinephelus coioides]
MRELEREFTRQTNPASFAEELNTIFSRFNQNKASDSFSCQTLTNNQAPAVDEQLDAFTRYSLTYPDFVEAVRFHHAFEEARVKSLQPGQEGQALVGFGDFKFETLQAVYESEDPKKILFVNYLRRKAPAAGTQMENAVRYVRNRDRQRARDAAAASTAAAAAAATTTTTMAAATATTTTPAAATATASSNSTASVSATSHRARSASQHMPLGSALAAFVSRQRSLSAVDMQAKIKRMLVPKPARPASFFHPFSPALPSKPSEEPSDEELVREVVDIRGEETTDVPAPLSLPQHPPPAPTSAGSRMGAGDSAVLGEPTDEELLEATLEQELLIMPPAALNTGEPAESPVPAPSPAAATVGLPPAPASLPPPAAATVTPPPAAAILQLPPCHHLQLPAWRKDYGRSCPGLPPSHHLLTVLSCCLSPGEQLSLWSKQRWIGRVLFSRDSRGRPQIISELNVWWSPPPTPNPGRSTTSLLRPPTPSLHVGWSWTSTVGISWPLSTWSAVDVRRRSVGGHRAS